MDIKKYIFSDNIKEIESLIEKKFKKELKLKFGHSNFPFNVKNTKINKFRRVFVSAVLDERIIEENEEVNYTGLSESRKVKKSDIDIFTYKRDNCIIDNVGKSIEYRVDNTNQTQSCGTCRGSKQITCDTCRGSGKNRCDGCNGQRKVKCSNCNGRGEVNCNMIFGCGGKGHTTSTENGRQVRRTCSSCNGRGKDPCSSCNNGYNTCSTCNGNGEVACFSCNSSGKVDCYSCDAQGSFTKYLSVRSVLIKKDNDLVVEGNNPGDFISQNILAEQFSFQKDFIKYQISELIEYKPQLKELFSGLLPGNNQQGSMIYASLDECASLTFEIVVGETTYIGSLKNGSLWFDDSVMSLLFYDMIDGMNVDSKFTNILSNKSAFDGNLNDTSVIWNSIKQYKEFDDLISSNKNVSNKISEARKFNLLNTSAFLQSLYPKFIKKETKIKSLVSIVLIAFLMIAFGRFGGLLFMGTTNFLLIPILSLLVTIFLTSYLIKSWKPKSVSILGFIIIFIAFILTAVNLNEKSFDFKDYLYEKEQQQIQYDENISKIKNFKNFKSNKLIMSNSEFEDLNSQSGNRTAFYSSNDSIIIVRPSENLKYSFFIDKGVEYRWTTNTHCSSCGRSCYGHDKVTEDRMGLNIGYNSFIENSGHYSKYQVRIGGPGGFADYEVSPGNIKFEISDYGITVMKNTLDDYTNNILSDAFINQESFLTLFTNSDLVNQHANKYYYYNSNGEMETTYIKPKIILNDNLSNKIYATSNVSNLNIRSTPALSDNIIDMLQLGDRVEVLDTIRIEIKTIKQALLNKDTFIEVEGTRILFKQGKAFEIIDEWPDETVSVLVDGNDLSSSLHISGNKEAIISKKNLDLIDKEIWLKIRLNNQQEGYVYQRFLNREIYDSEPISYIEIIEADDDEVFMVVEKMPEFTYKKKKGAEAIFKFINEKVSYPAIAKEYNITGKVYVSYVVDRSGKVINVKVVRGVDKNLDAEAIRVVKLMSPWYTSGKQRGKSVNVLHTIPINFTLN